MREIKFRAWDNIDKKLHADVALLFDNGKVLLWKERKPGTRKILHDCIVMQYTGLKDKNRKEIYEGDIVICGDYVADANAMNEWKKEVIFNDGCFIGVDGEVNEVIGNIYEHPELIDAQ